LRRPDLPLSRLLRLSLFQVSVGMALVLLIGTLNRVMIVELEVPASLVGIMISLPLIFAPFRALIGFKSDMHRSALGWRRVPFIWKGTMLQFGGLAIMPFSLLVLSGMGNAANAPAWIGQVGAGIAFLLVGAGLHTVQTVGLALATDLAPVESQPKVVGLMYVMLLVGMIVSAFIFGTMLHDFTPGRLVQVIQAAAVATLVLNVAAVWKQETRHSAPASVSHAPTTFRESWDAFLSGAHATRRLMVVGVGTMGFGMADVLLEPYGGQVLHLSVADTTKLTATLAAGGLGGFWFASRVLSRGADPFRMAGAGILAGIPGFMLVIAAAPTGSAAAFAAGTLLVGLGAGLFGHGTLTATMTSRREARLDWHSAPGAPFRPPRPAWPSLSAHPPRCDCGLALRAGAGPRVPYLSVYGVEVALLLAAIVVMWPLLKIGRSGIDSAGATPCRGPARPMIICGRQSRRS
jgi:BCD family chlorophyll transporter-like MFS transporter